jgi:hypothetical protein
MPDTQTRGGPLHQADVATEGVSLPAGKGRIIRRVDVVDRESGVPVGPDIDRGRQDRP